MHPDCTKLSQVELSSDNRFLLYKGGKSTTEAPTRLASIRSARVRLLCSFGVCCEVWGWAPCLFRLACFTADWKKSSEPWGMCHRARNDDPLVQLEPHVGSIFDIHVQVFAVTLKFSRPQTSSSIILDNLMLHGAASRPRLAHSFTGPTTWLDPPRLSCDLHRAQPRAHRRFQFHVQCCVDCRRDSPMSLTKRIFYRQFG